mgnify:FL=1
MASIKMKFRASSIHKGEGVIFFQIIHKRVVRQLATPYHIKVSEWNSITQSVLLENAELNTERNRYLADISAKLDSEYRLLCRIISSFDKKAEMYSADCIINEYRLIAKENTLSTFIKSIIVQLQQNHQHCTARNYQSTLNSFMRFRGGEDLPLDMMDATIIQSYEAWLKNQSICRNTSSFYMRILRAIYNRAVEKNLVTQQHPFRHVYTGIDKTRKRAVDLGMIKSLKQMDLTGKQSQSFARDMFLMSFCLRGISFVDLAKLRKTDIRGGYLYYTRSKTRQSICVKWEPIMQEITDKYKPQVESSEYLFPILSDDSTFNNNAYRNAQMRIGYNLKAIAKTLGLKENLTLYVARHSWATIARDSNVPVSVISEALGHDSELTTQIYLQSIQTSEVDKANASILGQLQNEIYNS